MWADQGKVGPRWAGGWERYELRWLKKLLGLGPEGALDCGFGSIWVEVGMWRVP